LRKIGPISLVAGALALVLVIPAEYGLSQIGRGTSNLVLLAGRLGLLAVAPAGTPDAIGPAPFLTLTDASVVTAIYWAAIALAALAMSLAGFAERRGEESLYVASGFMVGALCIFYANALVGLVAIVGGTCAIMLVRVMRLKNNRNQEHGEA
jgi:hypothetical protein